MTKNSKKKASKRADKKQIGSIGDIVVHWTESFSS